MRNSVLWLALGSMAAYDFPVIAAVLLYWIAAGLVLGVVLGRMTAFADVEPIVVEREPSA